MKRNRLGRALIVEDDPAWRSAIGEILTEEGLTVDVADTVVAAQSLMRCYSYRLAVVDLSLTETSQPDQQGLLVLQAIRQQAPFCPAILLTGYATVEIAVAALREYGALTCLRKETFSRVYFRTLIREMLTTAPGIPADKGDQPEPHFKGESGAEKQRNAMVVDDDAGWRDLLGELLGEMGFRVQTCAGLGEALNRLRHSRFDLAVVDLSLVEPMNMGRETFHSGTDEELGGVRLLNHIYARGIPAIVVSGLSSARLIEALYQRGRIHAFIEKQAFERRVFMESVQEILAQQGNKTPLGLLSDRERQVMNLLVEGYSNPQIAQELVISLNTVKRHLKSIFAKLGVRSRAAAVALVLKHRERDRL
ncbi:MAG: response regulator [Thermanaerothrix sp.]|nr:response regulator [Thermanaerothrix sp.]